MGKSPGKWIKTVLFGKKASKSNSSKRREIPKSAFEKASSAPVEESLSSLAVASSFTFETAPVNISAEIENLESGSGEVSKPTNEELAVSSSTEESDAQTATNNGLPYDSDRIQLEKAASKVQATYRGYLARRAFRTLKGIIRLQAVIRGHLVRRQAVATLYCVQGIVKFQALVRGQIIRHSDVGIEVRGKQTLAKRDADSSKVHTYNQEKLLKNAFIRQLLSSSPTAMPLRLQYDKGEPNSAWNWLLRWTMSHIWRPPHEPKKTVDVKQNVKPQKVGQKRSGQRKQSAHVTNASASPTIESVKLKHNPRKAINQSVKSVQKQPQKEIDEVKNETIPDSDRDFKSVEEQTSNGNHKIRKRRVSLPAARDAQETEQHGTRVRSYMAATASAKAKVRGQVSPRFGEDLTEKNGSIRRHSLPSSINGKVSSSPRVQRLTEASGKGGGITIDRSLSSSRDSNDKANQAEWKR